MTTAIAALVDVSVVTLLALVVCRALRRRPAALRHGVLASALAAAAAAPLLEIGLPRWELPVLPDATQMSSAGPTLSVRSSAVAEPAPIAPRATAPSAWTTALLALWGAGGLAVIVRLLTGLVGLSRLTRRCTPVRSGRWRQQADALSAELGLPRAVAIVESRDRALLLTWGFFRPRIIVPAGATTWTAQRIHAVLAHELAHIRRCDWLLHIGAEAVRAIYWFNPLVWWTCRRLRDESEQACDDAVLRRGIDPKDYAEHLLAVARHVVARGRAWAPAPAIVSPSTLERRIAAMLNASCRREPLTRASATFVLLALLAATVPLAAVTLTERVEPAPSTTSVAVDVALPARAAAQPTAFAPPAVSPRRPSARTASAAMPASAPAEAPPAQQASAMLSGTARDPSGGVLPGVELALTDLDGGIRYVRHTDGSGTFRFPDLPPSRYELVASLPGFSSLNTVVTLAAGQELQRQLSLRIGVVEESINVVCGAGAAVLAPRAATRLLAFDRRRVATRLFTKPQSGRPFTPPLAAQPQPVRVGGQIMAPRKIKDVSPRCPTVLVPPAGGVVVRLEGTIGIDGLMNDVRALAATPGEEPQPEFVASAMEAARQWQFTPTRLNNVPVPVIVSIAVNYRRR